MFSDIEDISTRRLSIEGNIFQGNVQKTPFHHIITKEVATENDNINQNDMEYRSLSIGHNIFPVNFQDNSTLSDNNQQAASENGNNNQNLHLSIENDFPRVSSNIRKFKTGYYCSKVRNDEIVNQDHNLYNTMQGNIDSDNCPSNSSKAINLEQDLFNTVDDLDEAMNCQQYTTTET